MEIEREHSAQLTVERSRFFALMTPLVVVACGMAVLKAWRGLVGGSAPAPQARLTACQECG